MNDRFSLLTRLTWRFDFNSRGLKSIDLISSSADVRRSRGEFDRLQRIIMTNPASIGLWLSLNAGESWWAQDLPQKLLNYFTIWSKVWFTKEEHRFLKKNFCEKRRPSVLWCDLRRPISRNRWNHGPRSGPTIPLSFRPSDCDQRVWMNPRVATRSRD